MEAFGHLAGGQTHLSHADRRTTIDTHTHNYVSKSTLTVLIDASEERLRFLSSSQDRGAVCLLFSSSLRSLW